MERGAGDVFDRERRAFHGLLASLSDVPDVLHSEQMAAAFVVEDMKREAPEAWEQGIDRLRDTLRATRDQEGIPGVTWCFAQEVYRRYDAFLTRCLQDEHDPIRQDNVRVLRQGIQQDLATRREAYEARTRVPMGSVIFEHVPQWFAQPS